MKDVLAGIRVVGVASWTFVPISGAVLHDDPQAIANGYLEPITASSGAEFRLPANPVQFDETAPSVHGAPEHGEHSDEVLLELGLTYDEIIEHKVKGAVL